MSRMIRRTGVVAVLALALALPGCSPSRNYPGGGRPGWSLGPERSKVKIKERKEKKDKKAKKSQGKKRGNRKGRGGGE
jgi:hypothetical protein